MNLTSFDKAIVAGLVSSICALLARYGWQPNGDAVNVLNVALTAGVSYLTAHILVYLKGNKPS